MAKRGENIRRRKDGRWEGRYIKSRTSERKPVWGYVYGSTYADVKETLIRKKAETRFYALSRTDLTFWELAEQWLLSIRAGIKESSFAHYQYTLHKYILPVLKNVYVSNLSENVLEQAMQVIISPRNQEHRPLGHSSAKECLSILRRICKYAAHLRLIRPMEICVTLPQEPHKKTEPLTLKEQKAIEEFVLQNPTPRKVGLLLGIQLGLRIGELCGLQWGDFDFIKNTLKIQRTVCRICCGNGHTKVVVQTPKTCSSRREIPLPKYLISVLKSIRKMQSDSAYLLSGCEDRPVEPRCYRKSIQCYLKQAKLRLVNPHTLRHTFATTCLQAGCDIKTLSELLGHSSPNITLQRYVHSDLARKRREIDRIFSTRSGVHPDGHEWMRAKWSAPIRKYWKISEQMMVKYCDLAICDSVNIEKYIHECYDGKGIKGRNPKTTFIAYGADLTLSKLADDDEKLVSWYKEKGLTKKDYFLVVGRFVPENSFEVMIREFMKSKSKKDFAIITNVNDKFLSELEKKLHFKSDKRIKFVGTVYDQELLKKIRENAYAYFHGHTVGGTNPSLIEALGSTDLNLLVDVGFNKEVAEDCALYWSRKPGSLAKLIDKADQMSADEIAEMGRRAKKRVAEEYTWDKICGQYEDVFTNKFELMGGTIV